jgi:hypothetical protein
MAHGHFKQTKCRNTQRQAQKLGDSPLRIPINIDNSQQFERGNSAVHGLFQIAHIQHNFGRTLQKLSVFWQTLKSGDISENLGCKNRSNSLTSDEVNQN